MKSFRKVFITRKSSFSAGLQLILLLQDNFFEEMQNKKAIRVIVTGERYLQILRDYTIPRIQNEHEGIENIIFIQDGTYPLIYRPVKELSTARSQNCLILTQRITQPKTLEELIVCIREYIDVIQPEMLNNALNNLKEWLMIAQQHCCTY